MSTNLCPCLGRLLSLRHLIPGDITVEVAKQCPILRLDGHILCVNGTEVQVYLVLTYCLYRIRDQILTLEFGNQECFSCLLQCTECSRLDAESWLVPAPFHGCNIIDDLPTQAHKQYFGDHELGSLLIDLDLMDIFCYTWKLVWELKQCLLAYEVVSLVPQVHAICQWQQAYPSSKLASMLSSTRLVQHGSSLASLSNMCSQ